MRNFARLLKRWSAFAVSGALLLVAFNFALNFARDGRYQLPIEKYTDLDWPLPYQYRILMVPVFRILISFFKVATLQTPFMRIHVPAYLATPEAVACFTVISLSFFIAMQIFRRIAFDVLQTMELTVCAVVLFVVITYATFILNPNLNFILPYDLPSLAFIQLGTLCIIREKWKTVIGLFAIATINRETTFLLVIFLTLTWWFYQRKEQDNSALITAAASVVIWAAIKLTLFLTITGNGTDAAGNHSGASLSRIATLKLTYNLAEFCKPWQWPALLLNLLPFGILVLLLAGRLKSHREWHMTAVFGYAALFPVAQVTEFRAFGDLIGFFAVSATLIFREYIVTFAKGAEV